MSQRKVPPRAAAAPPGTPPSCEDGIAPEPINALQSHIGVRLDALLRRPLNLLAEPFIGSAPFSINDGLLELQCYINRIPHVSASYGFIVEYLDRPREALLPGAPGSRSGLRRTDALETYGHDGRVGKPQHPGTTWGRNTHGRHPGDVYAAQGDTMLARRRPPLRVYPDGGPLMARLIADGKTLSEARCFPSDLGDAFVGDLGNADADSGSQWVGDALSVEPPLTGGVIELEPPSRAPVPVEMAGLKSTSRPTVQGQEANPLVSFNGHCYCSDAVWLDQTYSRPHHSTCRPGGGRSEPAPWEIFPRIAFPQKYPFDSSLDTPPIWRELPGMSLLPYRELYAERSEKTSPGYQKRQSLEDSYAQGSDEVEGGDSQEQRIDCYVQAGEKTKQDPRQV
ncbi:hypothetical protein FB451DRAFT_1375940 [Mycena latifolia]|nr:hypothetical protein FB451DRAFT_1375940 [Mycena latifolia]